MAPDPQPGTLAPTGDADADRLLNENPLALLIAMLLDQQIPIEWAFRGPAVLLERLGHLDAATIAATDPAVLDEAFREKPALHRYPAAMAKRAHALCTHIVAELDGDPARVWTEATSGVDLRARLESLPGFGPEKAMIFTAVLGKRMGVTPRGWRTAAGPFGDAQPRSVADIDGPEALARVREWKKQQKAAGKTKQQ